MHQTEAYFNCIGEFSGIAPQKPDLQQLMLDNFPALTATHARGEPMVIHSVHALSPSEQLHHLMQQGKIQSFITFPLLRGTRCTGFIGFDAVREERTWGEYDIALLQLLVRLLENARERARRERRISTGRKLLKASRDEAREMARQAIAASQAKADFVARVGHEIRTPLHAIIGLTDVLLEEEDAPGKQQHLSTIRNSSNILLALINDVLDFSKGEADGIEIKGSDFAPQRLLEEMQVMFEPIASRKGLTLSLSVGEGVPSCVHGDRLRIQQILHNLLSNAIKFTPAGSVSLRIDALQRHAEANGSPVIQLRFSVRDQGPGIPERHREDIFIPFVQLHDTDAAGISGTGLGLPIARMLANLMQGQLNIADTPGPGAMFTLDLALKLADSEPEQRSRTLPASTNTLRGRRILLAEDNPVNAKLVRLFLQGSGCELVLAGNGLEALRSHREQPADAILMDCNMPLLDGYETAAAIRSEEHPERRVPIIAVTAS
ncbi:MAG: ATP-binding protein, partial [Lamprobacter sp.]|uniref:ATP-binding protein n=1 Tax=Lamprobacter sp. TaxID=3100796 RepID=UPI002B25A307